MIAFSAVLPGAPYAPDWTSLALVPLLFVAWAPTVLTLRARRARITDVLEEVSPRLRVGVSALGAVAVAVFLWSSRGSGGQPERRGNRYFLNDHGKLTQVSHAAYRHALIHQQLVFTLIPSLFFAVAVLVLDRSGRPAQSRA